MKKQKAPIIPILLVMILLGWVGYSQLPKGKPEAPPQQDTKSTDVAKDVVSQVKNEKTVPTPKDTAPLRKVETSSLLKPDVSAMKPKPNPTSTASQWYDKDAAQTGG